MEGDVLSERARLALTVIDMRVKLYCVPPTLHVIADSLGLVVGESVIKVMRELVRSGRVVRVVPLGQRPAYVPVWLVQTIQGGKQ